jgi:ribonuclease P protein component
MSQALAKEVFTRGLNSSTSHFLIKTLPSPAGPNTHTLFAVSISKKIAPTAVLRNRTRRRVYAVIRDLMSRVRSGLLVGIAVKKGGEKIPYATIAAEIEKAHFLK